MRVIGVGLFFCLYGCESPHLAEFAHLSEPAIRHANNREHVLMVELRGERSETIPRATKALYEGYDSLRAEFRAFDWVKSPIMARWPIVAGEPPVDRLGLFAIRAWPGISAVPKARPGQPQILVMYWDYGDLGEVLHVGSYGSEGPSIARLKRHVEARGYRFSGGFREEVYVIGPGGFFARAHEEYRTVLRYQLERGSRGPLSE